MRVLVVDRDPLFSRLIETKLKNWGHRVTVEHDGSAAYKLIAKEPFRMVVMDYDLPGMDGWGNLSTNSRFATTTVYLRFVLC